MADSFNLEYFETNGIRVRAAVQGAGPLVIMVHGWPELWYSWRHQVPAVAAAGYRVVAPDVRGYGGSDKPHPVEAYDMLQLTGDVAGLTGSGDRYVPRGARHLPRRTFSFLCCRGYARWIDSNLCTGFERQ